MPRRKSSLGRSTKNAKRVKKNRANEDENLYSQRLESEKQRRSFERQNETSEHYESRLALKRHKKKLNSQAIMKEHKLASQTASPAVTRGALKRRSVQQNCPSSKRTKMVSMYEIMLR